MTTLLYHTDAYQRTCTAAVTGHSSEGNGIILDQTIAYCTSGGQPHDTGTIAAAGQEYTIVEVKKLPTASYTSSLGNLAPRSAAASPSLSTGSAAPA